MDERKINIDEFFDRQMGNHSETPPPAVWDALEKRLDEKPGRKRPLAIWWLWSISGLILISASIILAGYLYKDNGTLALNKPAQPEMAAKTAIASSSDNVRDEEQHSTTAHVKTPVQQTTSGTSNNNSNTTINNQTNKFTKQQTAPDRSSNKAAAVNTPDQGNNAAGIAAQPAQARQNDIASYLPHQTVKNIPLPVAAVTPSMQSVQLPKVLHTAFAENDQGDMAGKTEPQDTERMKSIPPSELIAEVTPADAFANPKLYNTPGMEETVDELPSLNPEDLNGQYTNTDTPKHKKGILNTDTTKSMLDSTVHPVDTKKKKPLPLEFGFKAGYSLGFNQAWRANKFAIAPYLEYRLPSKFSVILQPTFHMGNAKTGVFANSMHDYYEIISSSFDSTSRLVRGAIDSSVLTPNPPDTIFRTYAYGQIYDSIHVGYNVTSKKMWDVEVPVMVKYKVSKTFAFILGGSVTYSSVLQTKEEMTRYDGLVNAHVDNVAPATYYTTVQGQEPPPGPAPRSFSEVFTYNSEVFTGYELRKESTNSNFFRYGFMIGASATFSERLMIDVMLHKTGVDVNAVPDKELQQLYNQPYLRVMLGYKFSK